MKIHDDRIKAVSEKRIIEAYQRCLNEDKCLTNKITLKELEKLGYISKEINPKTKTYYNSNSYIIKNNDNYEFVIE